MASKVLGAKTADGVRFARGMTVFDQLGRPVETGEHTHEIIPAFPSGRLCVRQYGPGNRSYAIDELWSSRAAYLQNEIAKYERLLAALRADLEKEV